jgi:hypothetical protein
MKLQEMIKGGGTKTKIKLHEMTQKQKTAEWEVMERERKNKKNERTNNEPEQVSNEHEKNE